MVSTTDDAGHEHRLADGTRVIIRPVEADDGDKIRDAFERMSPESRYKRFFTAMPRLSDKVLHHLLDVDGVDRVAWAALDAEAEGQPGIGVARYYRVADEPDAAEAAVAVVDDYQRRGVGALLLRHLNATALENGITRFVGTVLVDNRPMLELVHSAGGHQKWDEPGVVRIEIDIPNAAAPDDHPKSTLFRLLRALAGRD